MNALTSILVSAFIFIAIPVMLIYALYYLAGLLIDECTNNPLPPMRKTKEPITLELEPLPPIQIPEPDTNQQWEMLIKKIFRAPGNLIEQKPTPEHQKPDPPVTRQLTRKNVTSIHLPTRTVREP